MKNAIKVVIIFCIAQIFLICTASAANNSPLKYHNSGAITGNNFHSIYFGARPSNQDRKAMVHNYCYGFSWYSSAWELVAEPVDKLQIGLTLTWITPNIEKHQSVRDDSGKQVKPLQFDGRPSEKILIQTMEGSLGWWRDTVRRTSLPKYHPGTNANNYHSFAREFRQRQAMPEGGGGWIVISNQILNPPDGMTLDPISNGGQLGQAWFALPFPTTGSQSEIPSGTNAWTLFLNSENFKGPMAYIAPQFWADDARAYPYTRNLTLDNNCGVSAAISQEWAVIPFYTFTDSLGNLFSKIPQLQFPADENGRTVFGRDYRGYSADAIYRPFAQSLNSQNILPNKLENSAVRNFTLTNKKNIEQPAHQENADLPDLQVLKNLQIFDGGKAYGLAWNKANAMMQLPTYFKENGKNRNAISKEQVPQSLQNASFAAAFSPKINFSYKTPQWFASGNPASGNFTTTLNDGSKVTYTWYKFVDQPMLRRFNFTEDEKEKMQELIVRIQKEWAQNPLIENPSAGKLITFDPGLFVTPPAGLEYGYVPIILQQE